LLYLYLQENILYNYYKAVNQDLDLLTWDTVVNDAVEVTHQCNRREKEKMEVLPSKKTEEEECMEVEQEEKHKDDMEEEIVASKTKKSQTKKRVKVTNQEKKKT